VYEPALLINGSAPLGWLDRYEDAMRRGDLAAALVAGMHAAQMGPPLLNALPRWVQELLVRMIIRQEDQRGTGEYVSMRAIAPTLHYDFQLVLAMADTAERFRAIQVEVLLMGGSTSPAYLKTALDALERVIPHATRIELSGLGHAASWNTDRGGQPAPVAQALRTFFT
jgi:hypothetical protein